MKGTDHPRRVGLMCAQALAVNGAKVYIVGRNRVRLEQAREVHSKGIPGELIPLVADVTSKSDITKLVQEVESREKCLHILVNNAGVAGLDQGPQASNVAGGMEGEPRGQDAKELRDKLFSDSQTFDTWTDLYRTNVAATYFVSVAFLPLLESATKLDRGYSGCIINITSISGITKQMQNHAGYNSSKGGAIRLNEMLAAELANNRIKIRVNSIAPGMYPSEMTAMGSDPETMKSELKKENFTAIPSERPGNDRDMANAVLFLATNQYLNGQTVPVDGGWLLVN